MSTPAVEVGGRGRRGAARWGTGYAETLLLLCTAERVADCAFVRDSASPGVRAFLRRQAPLRGK
ncbi:hypothetical protein FHR84_003002 [Actinopolyspora biskrensis]|uniref:Uncharacterized protein n=1 Tax=Actinopolyspora biskrensis TaxID=1470178 RepID=A0A852YX38_9ACTN|nr:hypothetical protein [Actinopolyspora biskrensis]NYH79664.1 hypothetical protein [Actinopolyspora biskrensis]